MKMTAKYNERVGAFEIYENRKAGDRTVNDFLGRFCMEPTEDNINAVIAALEALRDDLKNGRE